ncbi:hypothetical protein ACJD0Z_18675 [Flavobacteriaceae bacterium M23B6Z8]
MNITNTIKLIGFFILLALFTNCQKENPSYQHTEEETVSEHINNKKISRHGLRELKDDNTFKELTNTLELDNIFYNNSKGNSASRNLDLMDGNILVTDTINKVEKEAYVSYTFLVKNLKDSVNVVRNLVLEKYGDSISAYYINYRLDENWMESLATGQDSPPTGQVWLEDFKGSLGGLESRTICRYVTITVIIPCGCGDYYMSQCNECTRRPPRFPSTAINIIHICSDNETDLDLFGQEDDGGFGALGGSGTGSGNGDGDSDSMMNLPIDELMKAGMIFRAKTNLIENIELTSSQKAWLDLNGDQALMLNTLLITNQYSTASKNTIKLIIDVAKSDREVKEKVLEIKELLSALEPKLSQNIPRSTYIQRIVGINDFLRTHGYEDFATMMDPVIETAPGLSNKDLYDLYSFMFDMGREVQASFMVAVIMPFVEVAQIMVEFALLDTGITLAVKLLKSLPPLLKSIEITEVIKTMETSTILSEFKFAEKFGIKSYKDHDKFFKALNIKRSELGVEIHHLIEKRFAETLKVKEADMASIVLTKSEHQAFTNAWRNEIGLNGTFVTTYTTETATKEVIFAAARRIYKDYPEILIALGL